MSCPMSHVSTMGPGQETSADVFRLGSNTGSVSHQDPGQPPHPALSCLQRRGSPPGLSLLVDFVSIAETQSRPSAASAFPGVHRTQEGEGRCSVAVFPGL